MKLYMLIVTLALWLTGCGGSSIESEKEKVSNSEIQVEPLSSHLLPIPDNRNNSGYKVLMIGNSHSGSVKSLLASLLENSTSNNDVMVSILSSPSLVQSVSNQSFIDRLKSQQWTHVILQGQKYSQSQTISYPLTAAKLWIQRAKSQQATPVLFPEHPQKGNFLEANYVHGIHKQIAREEPSCVAPVGLAWDLALKINSSLDLYSTDGNHASSLGALLSSLVLFEVITGQSADLLNYNPDMPGDNNVQDFLGQMASQAIIENTPCAF